MMTTLVVCVGERARIDMRVEATFVDAGDGIWLPVFRPVFAMTARSLTLGGAKHAKGRDVPRERRQFRR